MTKEEATPSLFYFCEVWVDAFTTLPFLYTVFLTAHSLMLDLSFYINGWQIQIPRLSKFKFHFSHCLLYVFAAYSSRIKKSIGKESRKNSIMINSQTDMSLKLGGITYQLSDLEHDFELGCSFIKYNK